MRQQWTPEQRAAHSQRMKLAYSTEERRQAQSRRVAALWATDEHRVKQENSVARRDQLARARASYAGKLTDPEYRERIRKARRDSWAKDKQRKAATSARTIQAWASLEHRQLQSESRSASWASDEQRRANQSVRTKALWTDETFVDRWYAARMLLNSLGNSSLERAVASWLEALQVDFRQNIRFGRYVADIVVDASMLVIECDGDYWHSRPEIKARDARKDAYLSGLGYSVVRLPGKSIKQRPADCLELILARMV